MQDNLVVWQPGMSLEDLERKTILAAYRHYRSNKTLTAQSLGIAIRTLDHKLEAYAQSASTGKAPTRDEILKEGQKHANKTGAGGKPPGDPFESAKLTDTKGNVVYKTGFNGAMHPEQLAELKAAKLARMEKAAGVQEQNESNVDSAERGVSMESADEAPAQHALPVSERQEVQSVPLEVVAANSGRQNSGNLQPGNAKPANPIHNKSNRGGR